MPIPHFVASMAIVLVLAMVLRDTLRLFRGQRAGSKLTSVGLVVVSGLAAWQASLWLSSDHAAATIAFRAGVLLQLSGALAIAALSVVNLRLLTRTAQPT